MRKIRLSILIIVAICSLQSAMAWSVWGHNIVAYIAEKHLTPEAKERCQYYLKHNLPHYALWQDHWRSIPDFVDICNGHMTYLDKDFNVIGRGGDIDFDAVTRLNRHIRTLNDGKYHNLPDSIVAQTLKLIIHTTGDMHCPCHVSYSKDSGIRRSPTVYVNGVKTTHHKFWDRAPRYMHPDWKADDFLKAYDTYSKGKIKKICKKGPTDWGYQNAVKTIKSRYYWEKGCRFEDFTKEQRQKIDETLHEQLVFAGYRLAHILNTIFSK